MILFWGLIVTVVGLSSSAPGSRSRAKRSVEAFVREEVNSLEHSDLFLDTFLQDTYVLLEDSGSEEDEAELDLEADSTYFPPQLLKSRRTRSISDEKESSNSTINSLSAAELESLKELARHPKIKEWAAQAGSQLLSQLKGNNGTGNSSSSSGSSGGVDEMSVLKFLIDMLKKGEGVETSRSVEPVTRSADPSCLANPPILANDSRQVVREKQGKRMSCYLDTQVDPCEDFYEYACGNWEVYYPIPMDRGGYDTFEILREGLDLKLKELLAADIQAEDASSTRAVKTLFRSCMNTDEIERRGEEPLLRLLDRFGGWPVLMGTNWNSSTFDWINLIGELRLFNNDILVSLWVGPDGKNSDQYIIQFDQSDLVLPSAEYYHQGINHPIMKAYKEILVNVGELLGADRATAEHDMQQVIDFEIQLSKIMTPPHERRNFSLMYEKMTLAELSARVPGFNFTQYLDIVLTDQVQHEDKIVIYATKYFNKLSELLTKTESRILANYILMRFIRHRINNLDKRFEKIQNELYRLLYGRQEMPERWKFCIAYVNGNLGMAVGSLFVNKYFDEQSKQDMLNLTHEVQVQFDRLLQDSDWLSPNTKETAKSKLSAMIHNIGYPELVVDQDLLHQEIQGIDYNEGEFFENVLENLEGRTQKEMSMLGQRVNRTIWTTTPAVVNAYYSRNRNQIMFPAGILQPPFYHKYFPKAMNYGGIGVVIGHEITHGFDDKGKQFDDHGNIKQWWDQTSSKNFVDKAQCIIDQYGGFHVTEVGTNLNGVNTQGENIADNGGIKQAYRAFRRLQEIEGTEEKLPHLQEMNENQLFFLNFAQVWCGTARPEALRNKLKTAVHAPGKYRVLGTLANSKDFHAAFECAPGTRMNPESQCQVW